MAMSAHGHIFHARNTFMQIPEKRFILMRKCIANRVWHIDCRRSGLDSGFKDLAEVVPISTRGILSRKLDCRAEIACIGNHCLHTLKRLFSTQAKLVLKMDIRGCKKHMDHWLFSLANALPGSLDIASIGTS